MEWPEQRVRSVTECIGVQDRRLAERRRGGVGARTADGCHRRQLHMLEAAQRRDVGILGPAAIRVAPMTPTRRGLVIPSPALVMGSLR